MDALRLYVIKFNHVFLYSHLDILCINSLFQRCVISRFCGHILFLFTSLRNQQNH